MNGNSTQMLMFSDMVKRELRMEQPWHFMPNDMKINSQKQQSLKRLLKTIELLLKTSLVNQRIQVKVKLTEDPISFMELRMFKVIILGTLPDAFMENHRQEKSFQTTILENRSNQTAEMSLDLKLTDIDPLDNQPSVKIFHTKSSEVLLIIK